MIKVSHPRAASPMPDLFAPRTLAAGAALAALAWRTAAPTPAQPPAVKLDGYPAVRTQLTELCGRCHGEKASKGGVNLAPFADEAAVLRERKLWRSVAEQLKSGEMPPEGAKQPTADQRMPVSQVVANADRGDLLDQETADVIEFHQFAEHLPRSLWPRFEPHQF